MRSRAEVRRRRPAAALALGALTLLCTSCGLFRTTGLDLTTDNRLTFVSPPARALVHTPLTVRWHMSDFAPGGRGGAGPGGYFALFVDQAPIRPGQSMKAVAAGDAYCLHTPGCPDRTYLAQHQIYTTTSTSVTLPSVANLPADNDAVQLHTFVVVLMDPSGHRIGESAWELDLRLPMVGEP
ncbi:MAG TPA: hypothetical protein VL961_04140 [Acidimicrobiales bacterium]|nr:hypothetical protein [Acidimicrobiales bacterium]